MLLTRWCLYNSVHYLRGHQGGNLPCGWYRLVVSARLWNHKLQDNPEWHLLQAFPPIYETTCTDSFLNGFGLPLVVQRDWFLWSEKALVYCSVRLMWQHDRHGFIWTPYLLDYEQSWTLSCAVGRTFFLSRGKSNCKRDPQGHSKGAINRGFRWGFSLLTVVSDHTLSPVYVLLCDFFFFSIKHYKNLLRLVRTDHPLHSKKRANTTNDKDIHKSAPPLQREIRTLQKMHMC